MTKETIELINKLLAHLGKDAQKRWCNGAEGTGCCCMGCADGTGRLAECGISKQEWEEWMEISYPKWLEEQKAIWGSKK